MRPDWDSYFMKIAYAVSERSTCDRALVGCVLVLEKRDGRGAKRRRRPAKKA